MADELTIGGRSFRSRLIAGTGRHRSSRELADSIAASGAELVTVAIRRLELDDPGKGTILDELGSDRYTFLPNTAGCKTADEAVTVARLARSMGLGDMIKLEVVPDPKYLLPDPVGTVEAAERLIHEGFTVLPYINYDPILARRLEEMGCATVMPLAAPIGSGQGMVFFEQIKIIMEQASVPVVVDAGLGVPSDAAMAMELGSDAVLVNTAIAQARDPVLMAEAFRMGVEAGRKAFLAGRIARKAYASASSPEEGVVGGGARRA